MKSLVCLIFLIFGVHCFAQDGKEIKNEYNLLLNYAPKSIKIDSSLKDLSKKLDSPLNTIITLKIFYEFQKWFRLNQKEIELIEHRIDQLAIALFSIGKPVLIKKVGGYSGCPEKMIYNRIKNGKKVIILNFCFSCTDFTNEAYNFIKIFNSRMEKLLKLP
ncbi:hypothetical protein M0D21_15425 [Aquimarina sp. D1M17]|uniref:hypothetical protein n=1 Tax=Aquimarina acroporae TaxID=2937283 RepID=UPI0020BF4244|nr:hypothetical protein [Aquimarina acroporae]MCK8522967.1 hypothetical protein [Aquimarina acroporae]